MGLLKEFEVVLEPSGYQLVAHAGHARIYCYDTDGDKVDWREPGDERYDEWADTIGDEWKATLEDEEGRCHRGESLTATAD